MTPSSISLTRFLIEEQRAGRINAELRLLVEVVARACKRISNYLLLFDPLDGSSNIDVNISVGTIFSVLRCPDGVANAGDEHFLQPGTAQVAAGYCTYGPSTMLVLTVGHGTHAFTLDREVGSFVLTTRGMTIPEETKEFAVNMSNQRFWEAPMQAYVGDLLLGKEGPRGKDFNMRAQGRQAAADVRSQPDELAGGTGRRCRQHRPHAHAGSAAYRLAHAGAGVPGLEDRSGSRGRLPPRPRHRRYLKPCTAGMSSCPSCKNASCIRHAVP